ncbi:C39 family peptidase [Candidatus Woesearchaeota archaeon]|nr:C39 family peptidase [Candidatus Woesearchaeota archaeon]
MIEGVYVDLIQILYVMLILVLGFILANLSTRILIKVYRKQKLKRLNDENVIIAVAHKSIVISSIIIALLYLGFTTLDVFFVSFIVLLPTIIIVLLLLALGVYTINFVTWIIRVFINSTQVGEYIEEETHVNLVNLFILVVQIVLYLLLFELIVSYVELEFFHNILNYILYPVVGLLFLIVFVGAFNPVRDYTASFYLKNSYKFKPGNIVRFEKRQLEIVKITNLTTELKTKEGFVAVIPNRVLSSKELTVEKPSIEMETLESLKKHFVPQLKSHCGPACATMALAMFKIDANQEDLGKLMGTITRYSKKQKIAGTHPDHLISAITKYTKERVIGAWVDYDHIYDLEKEVARWLANGALIIVDYKKKYLFPEAKTAHYSLVVGVKGDQFLIVDPSQKSGGVYFTDYRDIEVGMDTYSELIKGKRGYIVIAPKGSGAFKRISEGLIYFHPSMYKRITKELTRKLNKMTNSVSLYETVPSFIKKYLKEYKRAQIQRVWRPEHK